MKKIPKSAILYPSFDQLLDLISLVTFASILISELNRVEPKLPPISPGDVKMVLKQMVLVKKIKPDVKDEELREYCMGINERIDGWLS